MAERRRFLKSIAAASAVGLAGCTGGESGQEETTTEANQEETETETDDSDGQDGNDGQDVEWPPPRRIVDVMVDTDPGGLIDILARTWGNHAESEYPGDITWTVTNQTGAQGVVLMNQLANQVEPNGGGLGGMRINSALVNQLGADQANYDIRELEAICRFSADTRALQFNPRTTPVEDHFEMTWEDFQNLAQEQTLTFPYSNSAQLVFASYIRQSDPVLNEDNWKFVGVSGGSEARAAIQRGDLDGYFGSYVSNISTRNDSYYTQFCMVNPEADPGFYDAIKDVLPETSPTAEREDKTLANNEDAIITNTSFPQENAEKVVQIVNDHHMVWLPPNTPDGIYDIHEEALSSVAESQELADAVAEAFSEPDHNPLVGSDVQEIAESKYQTFAEDEEVRTLIEENLF